METRTHLNDQTKWKYLKKKNDENAPSLDFKWFCLPSQTLFSKASISQLMIGHQTDISVSWGSLIKNACVKRNFKWVHLDLLFIQLRTYQFIEPGIIQGLRVVWDHMTIKQSGRILSGRAQELHPVVCHYSTAPIWISRYWEKKFCQMRVKSALTQPSKKVGPALTMGTGLVRQRDKGHKAISMGSCQLSDHWVARVQLKFSGVWATPSVHMFQYYGHSKELESHTMASNGTSALFSDRSCLNIKWHVALLWLHLIPPTPG